MSLSGLFPVCASWVFLLVANAESPSAERVLEWRFLEDQQRQHEVLQEVVQTVNDRKLESVTTLNWTSQVTDVDENSSATLTKTITRVAIALVMPDGSRLEYDSATSTNPTGTSKILADVLKPLIGWQVQVTVAGNGEVKEINPSTPISVLDQGNRLFSPMILTGQLEQLLKNSILTFPAGQPLTDRLEWRTKDTASFPVGKWSLASDTKYIYRGQKEENGQTLDRIDVQTTIDAKSSAPTEGQNADGSSSPIVTISDQRSSGEVLFDAESSVLVRSKAEQAMTLTYPVGDKNVTQSVTVVTSQSSFLVRPAPPAEEQAAAEPSISE